MVDGGVAPDCAPLVRKKVVRASGSELDCVAVTVTVLGGTVVVIVFDMLGLWPESIQKCSHG